MIDDHDGLEQTERYAVLDPLTGTYTRALLKKHISGEVATSDSTGTPFSLAVIDLDHLKSINDAYGHLRGDEVIKEIANRIKSGIRPEDRLYRYGGDEFVLLLPQVDEKETVKVVEKVMQSVQGTALAGSPPLSATLSVGVATYRKDADSVESLFEAADNRAYEAKRRGRAQYVYSNSISDNSLPFNDLSRMIDRDEELKHFNQFINSLKSYKMGIFGIHGVGGSGKTKFLKSTTLLGKLLNYSVVILNAARSLKNRPYGALIKSDIQITIKPEKTADEMIDEIAEYIINNRISGLFIAIDNLHDLDRPTLGLIRKLLISNKLPSVAVVYTSAILKLNLLLHLDTPLLMEVELKPFSLEGLHVLLRGFMKSEPPPAFLQWLIRETGGLPAMLQKAVVCIIERGIIYQSLDKNWLINPEYDSFNLRKYIGIANEGPRHNLPEILTNFIGREEEIHEIKEAIVSRRLVTLLGPGGIGKTRLSMQVAIELVEDFTDGVFFIDLQSIKETSLVAPAIANTLGVKEKGDEKLMETLKLYLQEKRQLLILDNYEQVIESANILAELLSSAPYLKLLVTSREILNISGELVYEVPTLSLPDKQKAMSSEEYLSYESIQLFYERVQSIKRDYKITEENGPVIAGICRKLDGVPLAIELAAAQIRFLSADFILERLNNRLGLLTGGARDLPERQRTIRATIAWSYNLLDETEQTLFRQSSIFEGSFSEEGLNAVGDIKDNVKETLAQLVNKSLIRKQGGGEESPRYILLETIKEYTYEQMQLKNEVERLRESHARYYLELVETLEELSTGEHQERWLNMLESEHHNIRAVLTWAAEKNEVELSLRVIGAVWKFWHIFNHLSEGRKWIEPVIEQSKIHKSNAAAKALWGGGWIALVVSDLLVAKEYFEMGLSIAKELDDKLCIGRNLHGIGAIERWLRNYDKATQVFRESLDYFEEVGDREHVAWTHQHLGVLKMAQGQYSESIKPLKKSLAIFKDIKLKWPIAELLSFIGDAWLEQGEYDKAIAIYKESNALYEELGSVRCSNVAKMVTNFGRIAKERGNYKEALTYYKKSLLYCQEIDDKWGLILVFSRFAELARLEDDRKETVKLWSATKELSKNLHIPMPQAIENKFNLWIKELKAEMETGEFNNLWNEGKKMTIEDTIQFIHTLSFF